MLGDGAPYRYTLYIYAASPAGEIASRQISMPTALPIHCLFTFSSLPLHCLCAPYTLRMHCLRTTYLVLMHCLFSAYSLGGVYDCVTVTSVSMNRILEYLMTAEHIYQENKQYKNQDIVRVTERQIPRSQCSYFHSRDHHCCANPFIPATSAWNSNE
jgi:hypothetical protein